MLENWLRSWQAKVTILVVAVLVLGALLGLLSGWGVWPVRWYDADPSDLRLQHQINYVLMAADSLAMTGNADVARARLYELLDERTSLEQLANLVERVAVRSDMQKDPAAAARVRLMARTLALPQSNLAEYREPSQRVGVLEPWIGYIVLFLAVLLGLAIALRFLPPILRANPQVRPSISGQSQTLGESMPTDTAAPRPSLSWLSRPRAVATVDDEEEEVSDGGDDTTGTVDETPRLESDQAAPDAAAPPPVARPVGGVTQPLIAETLPPWEETPEQTEPEETPATEPTTVAAEASQATTQPSHPLGVFEAHYAFGDDDLDLSFVIESAHKEFLGECGIGIVDVLREEGGQQVDAFEVWLFDRSDVHAESRAILVSDYANRTPAVSARLGTRGQLVLAKPGAQIVLETLALRLTATVQDFGYAPETQPINSYFDHLTLELVAERNSTTS